MATSRMRQFTVEMTRARDLVGLGQSVYRMTGGRVDGSDMYRAALVHAVAALDSYIHGIVLDRGVDMLMGRLANSGSKSKVGLQLSAVQEILNAPNALMQEVSARAQIAQRLSLETFQKPDDVANGLAMVGISKVWSIAFPNDPGAAKAALGVIVQRRNRIVHQCDADPLTPGAITPLSDGDALDSISTVQAVVAAIDPHC
ncbi:hypothetical protein KBX71_08845 [Micromonospora sp. D93]|uniref:hypothetical protein n=1 Tax=Micromonospora sp. D93 TaxID=2824886 RepID=UPI001B367C8E|nr:hypothetical protein [Micromonospora sp. D93]MBQ1017971.1 hypothetical protein [Micromonospora sp. D93]